MGWLLAACIVLPQPPPEAHSRTAPYRTDWIPGPPLWDFASRDSRSHSRPTGTHPLNPTCLDGYKVMAGGECFLLLGTSPVQWLGYESLWVSGNLVKFLMSMYMFPTKLSLGSSEWIIPGVPHLIQNKRPNKSFESPNTYTGQRGEKWAYHYATTAGLIFLPC